ncbi:hypothetical protein CAPTEDRAFT_194201 [Capitella teleta]|uniref:Retrotransposon gag domain-containing protein n=1 Tax=Capitella teleta TaxID=283909 RepID=R7U0R7_CAPTE|nr:hypothetical protein CAPTEDRAFT_194201 [Capitella teleta]|eukprot:ELT99599.1 hypothetical protein CAPTEDRAFT_194201 [Capitella teleta]
MTTTPTPLTNVDEIQELTLAMAALSTSPRLPGEDKPSKYICNFVKVCSGERGKAILRESNAHKEEKDYQVIIKALEQKVKPSNEELSASSKYFYLRQGNATLVDFFKQATEIVEAMNIDEDPKDKTLRNLLMNGLTSREIYRECLKEKADQLSSKRVMEIASNIEARNLMDEDLSDMANQLLPSNALSRGSPSSVNKIHHENSNDFSNSQLSKFLSCGWCGGRKRCRRQECPAKDSQMQQVWKDGTLGQAKQTKTGNVTRIVRQEMKIHMERWISNAGARSTRAEISSQKLLPFELI